MHVELKLVGDVKMTPKLQRILGKNHMNTKLTGELISCIFFLWNVCSGSSIPLSLKLSKGLQNPL